MNTAGLKVAMSKANFPRYDEPAKNAGDLGYPQPFRLGWR
jgi:hypothetical protein